MVLTVPFSEIVVRLSSLGTHPAWVFCVV